MALLSITFFFCDIGTHVTKTLLKHHFLNMIVKCRRVMCFIKINKLEYHDIMTFFVLNGLSPTDTMLITVYKEDVTPFSTVKNGSLLR